MKDEDSAQKKRTDLLYQHFLHFLELESHSKGDQARGGGSRRGGDGCQGSRFQSVRGPAGNSDVIINTGFGNFSPKLLYGSKTMVQTEKQLHAGRKQINLENLSASEHSQPYRAAKKFGSLC